MDKFTHTTGYITNNNNTTIKNNKKTESRIVIAGHKDRITKINNVCDSINHAYDDDYMLGSK